MLLMIIKTKIITSDDTKILPLLVRPFQKYLIFSISPPGLLTPTFLLYLAFVDASDYQVAGRGTLASFDL